MPLGVTEQQQVRDHLARWHGGPLRCVVCGQQDWALWQIEAARYMFERPRPGTPSDALDPVIALTCQQCGNLVTLDPQVVPGLPLPGYPGAP